LRGCSASRSRNGAFYFLRKLLLFLLIAAGHLRKAVVAELAGNIVLIDALEQAVQFIVAGKE
jgi:hypothetical protein